MKNVLKLMSEKLISYFLQHITNLLKQMNIFTIILEKESRQKWNQICNEFPHFSDFIFENKTVLKYEEPTFYCPFH